MAQSYSYFQSHKRKKNGNSLSQVLTKIDKHQTKKQSEKTRENLECLVQEKRLKWLGYAVYA